MNGRITIELGGVKTPLTFGMMAVEEFGNMQSIGSAGWAKMMIDLVYAGYCNEKTLERKTPELSYRELSELMDDLLIAKDPILSAVFKCFESSKAGSELFAEVKKKLEEEGIEIVNPEKKQTGTK